MVKPKVYVSSTFLDLQECRRQVSLLLRQMGLDDVAMEYYTAGDQRPVERCVADVEACDLYIGLFAWRYGWRPKSNNPQDLSITELEYRKARETNKECLIFLLDEKAPWSIDHVDEDRTQIKRLRNELAERHSRSSFISEKDIASVVAPAVHQWLIRRGLVTPAKPSAAIDPTAYYDALRKKYQQVGLEGLTPPQREEFLQLQLRAVFVEQHVRENPPPIELPKDVWEKLQGEREISPQDLPAGIALEDLRRVREAYYEKDQRLVWDVLTEPRHEHTVLLGDPGSGKSTLARYLVLSLVEGPEDDRLRRAFAGWLPVLIELKSYASLSARNKCDTFLEYLDYIGQSEGWQLTRQQLQNYLRSDGRAVVNFDGLDEIFNPAEREQVAGRIAGFARDFPKVRIVVTSRVLGYQRKVLTDAGFAHFTLQDLEKGQVAAFAERWYGLALADRPAEAGARRERLLDAYEKTVSIRQLAGNPMLLTIMAIIGKNQELPRERWKLYDHAVSVLLQHWDANKFLRDQGVEMEFIGEEDKKELLRGLAHRMQAGGGGLAGNYIHRDELQKEFEEFLARRYRLAPDRAAQVARAMIEQLRQRNFILSLYGANLYGFVHRAFLEYFCATALLYRFEKTQELTLEQLKTEVYGAHWEDQSWHEVLRLICGMMDERFAAEVISYLIEEVYWPWPKYFGQRMPWNLALAAHCMAEVRNLAVLERPGQTLLERMSRLFQHLESELALFVRNNVLPPVESMGETYPGRGALVSLLSRFMESSGGLFAEFGLLGRFIGVLGGGIDQLQVALLAYAQHPLPQHRAVALIAMAIGWPHGDQMRRLLRQAAEGDVAGIVRRSAVLALAEQYRHDPETLPLVSDLARSDPDESVRKAAVRMLVTHYKEDPGTVPLLRQKAESDPHEWVRLPAVEALAKQYRNDPGTVPLVRELARNDTGLWVRRGALEILAQYYRDDPATLYLVRQRVEKDESHWVRQVCVKILADHYRDDPTTLPVLRHMAETDPHKWVRREAIRALIEHWPLEAEELARKEKQLRKNLAQDEG